MSMASVKITFLEHSGFTAELSDCILVFDFHEDPAHVLEPILHTGKPVYFFVSHVHGDHFNPEIRKFAAENVMYVMHRDCILTGASEDHVCLMDVGGTFSDSRLCIEMGASTDAGGSFWIRHSETSIFHAGDLNWWHWFGDPENANREARDAYFREIERVSGRSTDIAFFPVDARQEAAREWGAEAFLEAVEVKKAFVPMHAFGTRWNPSCHFRWRFRDVPVWVPCQNGDSYIVEDQTEN